VFSEPVDPISTMSALPPYWVRLELRKKLVVEGCAVGWGPPAPTKKSRNSSQPGTDPPPAFGMDASQFSTGAESGREPAT
jgi:hypothetical protein